MALDAIQMKYRNGDVLKGHAWTTGNPKGNVIIVTGMLEHSLRYDEFACELNKAGYDVFCIDHFGQGMNVENPSDYTIVPTSMYSKFVKHTDELVSKLRASCKPTYIFAHSMGSFMMQDYIQRFTEHVNKVVLCGSCGKQAGVGIGYQLARLTVHKKQRSRQNKFLAGLILGSANKTVKNPKTPNDWLSWNEENVAKYNADPLCGGIASGGFYREFLKGLNRNYKHKFLKKIRKDINILLVAGEDDPVGKMGKGVTKLYKMYKGLGLENVEMKLYPHMRHEILNEDGKAEVMKDIIAFLDKEVEAAEPMLSK